MTTTTTTRQGFTPYGPGDPVTWGAVWHPLDPRAEDPCDDCNGCPDCCPELFDDHTEEEDS